MRLRDGQLEVGDAERLAVVANRADGNDVNALARSQTADILQRGAGDLEVGVGIVDKLAVVVNDESVTGDAKALVGGRVDGNVREIDVLVDDRVNRAGGRIEGDELVELNRLGDFAAAGQIDDDRVGDARAEGERVVAGSGGNVQRRAGGVGRGRGVETGRVKLNRDGRGVIEIDVGQLGVVDVQLAQTGALDEVERLELVAVDGRGVKRGVDAVIIGELDIGKLVVRAIEREQLALRGKIERGQRVVVAKEGFQVRAVRQIELGQTVVRAVEVGQRGLVDRQIQLAVPVLARPTGNVHALKRRETGNVDRVGIGRQRDAIVGKINAREMTFGVPSKVRLLTRERGLESAVQRDQFVVVYVCRGRVENRVDVDNRVGGRDDRRVLDRLVSGGDRRQIRNAQELTIFERFQTKLGRTSALQSFRLSKLRKIGGKTFFH